MCLQKIKELICALLCFVIIAATIPLSALAELKGIENMTPEISGEASFNDSSENTGTAPSEEPPAPQVVYTPVEISKETKDFLATIDGDVTLTVISSETDFAEGAYIEYYNGFYSESTEHYYTFIDTLKTISELNEYIKLEFVDPFSTTSYSFISNYSAYELKYGDLFISCYSNFDGAGATRSDVIELGALFKTEKTKKGTKVVGVDIEKVLVSKLQSLRTYRNVNVAYIKDLCDTGNIKHLKSYMKGMRYEFDNITLKSEKLNGYDMIIIAAPRRDITLEEIVLLDTFLDNNGRGGKTIVYMCSENYVALPNFNAFLRKWGIAIREDNQLYCNDEDGFFAKNSQLFAASTGTKYTKTADSEGGFYIMDKCMPLSIVETNKPVEVSTILESRSEKVCELLVNNLTTEGNAYADADLLRGYPLLTLSQTENRSGSQSNVVVAASVDFITSYMALQNPRSDSDYRGELNGNLALFAELLEKLNRHHRNEESGLGKYAVTLKDMGYDTTSGLVSGYILKISIASGVGFILLLGGLLLVFKRRKRNVGKPQE